MSKGTSIKEAIKQWEEKEGTPVADATVVKLLGKIPPIEKMDAALSALSHVQQLSLSTNCIEKIANLNGFNNLRILSLGRNNIKSLAGLEPVSKTLEELWISYNNIEKLKGIEVLSNLKVLYISNNKIADWKQFDLLAKLPSLESLVMTGNPLQEKHMEAGDWAEQVAQRLPSLKKLDGVPVVRDE
ncbi:dynein light chain 1 [Salpingoeca rosetta]|uniref:Dynein axonemal light chain 1 n=1 Tax=Salpingoeca rosetta (strain ATCC 50818 / BSB-021) TaxID=946362 RepID=F2TZU8_SALR5|nr:dynein light chain 1 [Salpingoeca rosetta]EGD80676.1 dynein light chain 1 [Salpingoeca rosetta]|eukprot:XP_004997237.1 dynein light chain 1 [Salpingoeca rosetta]